MLEHYYCVLLCLKVHSHDLQQVDNIAVLGSQNILFPSRPVNKY